MQRNPKPQNQKTNQSKLLLTSHKITTCTRYTVTHRGELDYQDFTNERTSNAIKRPKELVVTVELPGLVGNLFVCGSN